MYINKPSVTKTEAVDKLIFCIILDAALNSMNLQNLAKCLYPCPDMRHFMIVTKNTLAFRHRNKTLANFIKPGSILKQLCIRLVEVVNVNKQLFV